MNAEKKTIESLEREIDNLKKEINMLIGLNDLLNEATLKYSLALEKLIGHMKKTN